MAESAHESWYSQSANRITSYPELRGAQSYDVCVLGAGITGLSTALNLAEAGFSVCVLEAYYVGWGASGRSGGQMIFGFGADQSRIESLVGKDDAKKIWDAGLHGMKLLRQRVHKHDIRCDLKPGHAHVAIKPRQVEELRQLQESLEKDYGYPSLEFWDESKVRHEIGSPRYLAGLLDHNSGHLHPLNYTLGLADAAEAAGVEIFEQSPVQYVLQGNPVRVTTPAGEVKADYLVLAGNAYLHKLMPSIEARIMPVGTYICASERLDESTCRSLLRRDIAVADINFVLDYFRCSSDHRMLFGGRVSYSTLPPMDLKAAMGKRMASVFPQLRDAKVDFAWGGYVDISMNRAPDFGRIGGNIFYAQGFSGHGIASTGLAGELMAQAIQGNAAGLDLFSRIPHQPFPGGRTLRTPALMLAMAWYRMRDLL